MKINSSGKERSHKLLQANCHISLLLWYSLMMYIKSIHYCPVHQLDYPALRLSFSSSSFYLSAFVRFLFIQCMYLLTKECSAFLSGQAK